MNLFSPQKTFRYSSNLRKEEVFRVIKNNSSEDQTVNVLNNNTFTINEDFSHWRFKKSFILVLDCTVKDNESGKGSTFEVSIKLKKGKKLFKHIMFFLIILILVSVYNQWLTFTYEYLRKIILVMVLVFIGFFYIPARILFNFQVSAVKNTLEKIVGNKLTSIG